MNAPSDRPGRPAEPGRPADPQLGRPVVPSRGRLRPLGLHEVRITGGFWGERQHVNASATLEHCLTWMDSLGWIGNFRPVDDATPRTRAGREFSDSEIYKLTEAMVWELARTGDAGVDDRVRDLTKTIGAAQHPDGYLNTAFGGPGQPARYIDLEWGHELYCYGFLIQAAVARGRVTGADDDLVRIARKAADHVCDMFGPDGRDGVCGHPEIEMALVELARFTGEQRYLDQAELFVARRGRPALANIEFGREYYQDDVPVREASIFRGHAVRALYLAAGAVDVATETGDDELLDVVQAQWRATVARRTYITGGMGSRYQDEAFAEDFALPPDRAYSETCAAVASVMLSWRLLLATGDPRYADLAERTLYNVVATSPAADGRSFFYVNPLHRRVPGVVPDPDVINPRAWAELRSPWFAVSCCPNNVARTLASLPAYLATVDDDGLQVHQYADAEITTTLDDGRTVGLEIRTRYPDDGVVTVRVTRTEARPWTLTLRVPAWAGADAWLTGPDGQRRPVSAGAASLTRAFTTGDEIRLELPVHPRWVEADPRVDAVRGTVAVERGPVVLCAESVDLPGDADVDAIRVDPSVRPSDDGDGRVTVVGALTEPAPADWPYHDADTPRRPARGEPDPSATTIEPSAEEPDNTSSTVEPAPEEPDNTSSIVEIPLVPYHSWASRGPSTMRIWLPHRGGTPGAGTPTVES